MNKHNQNFQNTLMATSFMHTQTLLSMPLLKSVVAVWVSNNRYEHWLCLPACIWVIGAAAAAVHTPPHHTTWLRKRIFCFSRVHSCFENFNSPGRSPRRSFTAGFRSAYEGVQWRSHCGQLSSETVWIEYMLRYCAVQRRGVSTRCKSEYKKWNK